MSPPLVCSVLYRSLSCSPTFLLYHVIGPLNPLPHHCHAHPLPPSITLPKPKHNHRHKHLTHSPTQPPPCHSTHITWVVSRNDARAQPELVDAIDGRSAPQESAIRDGCSPGGHIRTRVCGWRTPLVCVCHYPLCSQLTGQRAKGGVPKMRVKSCPSTHQIAGAAMFYTKLKERG